MEKRGRREESPDPSVLGVLPGFEVALPIGVPDADVSRHRIDFLYRHGCDGSRRHIFESYTQGILRGDGPELLVQ